MILEFEGENAWSNLRMFNCSWLSSHSDQHEILFIGGDKPLRLQNIRCITNNIDYHKFLQTLSLLNNIIDGKEMNEDDAENITQLDYDIIIGLMRNKDPTDTSFKNSFPEYINNYFKYFCDSKKQIHVRLDNLTQDYNVLGVYLICEYVNNLLDFDYLSILFPNVERIIVWGTGNISSHCKGGSHGVYECKFVTYLLDQLEALNRYQMADTIDSKLKMIKLYNVTYNHRLLDDGFLSEFTTKFNMVASCDIEVEIMRDWQDNPENSNLIINRKYDKEKMKMKMKLKDKKRNGNVDNVYGQNEVEVDWGSFRIESQLQFERSGGQERERTFTL